MLRISHPVIKSISAALLLVTSASLIVIGITACCVNTRIGELPDEAEQRSYSALQNYRDGIFINREEAAIKASRGWFYSRALRFFGSSENAPGVALPSMKLDKNSFPAVPEDFAFYWLGHSSLIFELDGIRFMTDPVFGNAAPIPGAVRRYCESPLERENIPPLDFIIISHDHYDHLEYDTIVFLRTSNVIFIVPLGVGAHLRGWGIPTERIRELNWDESIKIKNITLTAQTARHFSGRSLDSRNKTLWASFVIEGSSGRKVFFGADSGYGKHFKETGEKYGPFDLVCLEIDAWNERWPNTHLFPDETVTAMNDLKGRLLLPIHWGVFDLAMHPWDESIRKVSENMRKAGLPMTTPLMGEKVVPDKTSTAPWWELKQSAE